jgi:3-oxoacyl-[acyl-carrier protein] reductase
MEGKSEQFLKMIASMNPNNRLGTPEEVADAIVLICSTRRDGPLDKTIKVNGGQAQASLQSDSARWAQQICV